MEGNDDEASIRLEHMFGGNEGVSQFAKLVVDENAQCLEGTCSGMNRACAGMHDARNEFGKRACGNDGVFATRFDDGARYRPRETLFAQSSDYGRKVALARVGDDIGRARASSSHPHVERPIEPERKSARRLVELHRRHAEIEYDAIGGAGAD